MCTEDHGFFFSYFLDQLTDLHDLVGIETSTKTFFADGLFSHNSVATMRDQAKLVWTPAKRMLVKNEDLRAALGVETNAHNLYQPSTGSVFSPLSSDQDTLDGLNIYAAA